MRKPKYLYQRLQSTIKGYLTEIFENHLETICMMVIGLIFSKQANLSKMTTKIPHHSKEKSVEKRMVRLLKNKKFLETKWFTILMKRFLKQRPKKKLYLTIDTSCVGRKCIALMVGVVFQKRAIPLCWRVYKGKKGHLKASRHVALLKKVLAMLPEGTEVILLGDAEFDSVEVLKWIAEHTDWSYVLRSGPNIKLYDEHSGQRFDTFGVKRGQIKIVPNMKYTARRVGPLQGILWWGKKYEHPIYLVSNFETGEEACQAYRKRFAIETLFSDQKSRGFGIDKSRISNPKRLSRLLFAVCLAYLWVFWLGKKVLKKKLYKEFDRTDRVDKSIFRLGLDFIDHCRSRGKTLPIKSIWSSMIGVR